MSGRGEYKVRLSLAGKYRIGLNIIRAGKVGVKGLFLEYGEYSAEYSPTVNADTISKIINLYKIIIFQRGFAAFLSQWVRFASSLRGKHVFSY